MWNGPTPGQSMLRSGTTANGLTPSGPLKAMTRGPTSRVTATLRSPALSCRQRNPATMTSRVVSARVEERSFMPSS